MRFKRLNSIDKELAANYFLKLYIKVIKDEI